MVKYSLEELRNYLVKSSSLTELVELLGFNNKSYSCRLRVKNDLIKYGLDFSHLKFKKEKYLSIKKNCPVCNNIFETINSGNRHEKKYCSKSCCNKLKLGNRHSKESRFKTSKTLTDYYSILSPIKTFAIQCSICNNIFYRSSRQKLKVTCSSKCRGIYFSNKSKAGEIDFSNTGGYREKSGRGKCGWYKGYYCASSWELAWVIYNLERGIKFKRNLEGFEYLFNDKKYKYYPDFYIPDTDEYIEIKGFINEKTFSKINQFPKKITILFRKEMKSIIDYVISKYGKDYIKFYENKSP